MDWRLAEASKRFGELVNRALTEGPQRVHRGNDTVVVLAQRDYDKLARGRPSFKQLLLNGPGLDDLEIRRDRSPMRAPAF